MLMGKVLEQPWLHSRTSGQHQDLLLKAASAGKSGHLSWGDFFLIHLRRGHTLSVAQFLLLICLGHQIWWPNYMFGLKMVEVSTLAGLPLLNEPRTTNIILLGELSDRQSNSVATVITVQ
jgi:hypothetical protein